MSLVLDALRRREAESDPTRRTLLDAPRPASRGLVPWVALVAVGLLINAVLLTWFMVTRDASGPATSAPPGSGTTTTVTIVEPTPAPSAPALAAPEAVVPQPALAEVALQPETPAAVQARAQSPERAPDPAPVASVRTLERIELEDLPDEARRRLPGIVISSHIHADDPMERTIIANGVTLREGSVLAGLPLREIREDSIVVEFESWLLEIPVFGER
ncbi:MAG: general secretion pathway protein GspB [Pseudomonadales bacterium]